MPGSSRSQRSRKIDCVSRLPLSRETSLGSFCSSSATIVGVLGGPAGFSAWRRDGTSSWAQITRRTWDWRRRRNMVGLSGSWINPLGTRRRRRRIQETCAWNNRRNRPRSCCRFVLRGLVSFHGLSASPAPISARSRRQSVTVTATETGISTPSGCRRCTLFSSGFALRCSLFLRQPSQGNVATVAVHFDIQAHWGRFHRLCVPAAVPSP